MKTKIAKILKFLFPFVLGGGILWWMYRDFPFSTLDDVLLEDMHWEWMVLSFIPGILAQVFRGLRWHQALEPLEEHPHRRNCVLAVYISYAASLLVPRIGEVTRCGVLKRQDGISFSKSLGTVVTERIVDSLLVLLMVGGVLLWQLPVVLRFFNLTGVGLREMTDRFTSTGIIVTIICLLCIVGVAVVVLQKISVSNKLKDTLSGMWTGIMSLRKVRNVPLYLFYSVGIWVAYFLHYYLTFFCFDSTAQLGLTAGLVSFCIGTIAVIVPTPNGAGSWHFAVKTILVLYGLGQMDAVVFVLIVHGIQTLLIILLGIYALLALQYRRPPALHGNG